MTRRLRRCAIALIGVLALVAGACGNEADDTGNADGGDRAAEATDTTDEDELGGLERVEEPDPCQADPGVSDTEIRVGVIAIESGPSATSFAPAIEGVRARIEKANQEGELGDRTIRLVVRDDTGDQTRNLEVARDLVEQENVFGIIEDSSVSTGSAEYLNEQGVPVTGWHVGAPAWSIYPNMFAFRLPPSGDPDHEYNTRNAELLTEEGATKVALIGGGNEASASFMERVKRTIEQLGETEVVYENVSIATGQSDFTAEAQQIRDSGADGVLTGMDLLQNAALNDALTKADADMKVVLFPGGYDPRVIGLPGMEGSMFGLEFWPFELNRPAFQEFDRWAPESTVRGQVPFIGWLSAEMFVQGLKEAGLNCPTREAFITNLRLLDDYDGGGAFDPVDLSEGFGEEFRCIYYVKVEDGAFVPQFDGQAVCGDPIEFE